MNSRVGKDFSFQESELHPLVANQELGILNSQSDGGFKIKGACYEKYKIQHINDLQI